MWDWTTSMNQTFEYYKINPETWKDEKKLDSVKSCTILRDSEVETLGSATIDAVDLPDECYIRVYLIATQNGITNKIPLGTFLVQTPSFSFDGKIKMVSVDAYTPLLELKESPPPLGYFITKGENIMTTAYRLCREHIRAPVVKAESTIQLFDDFVANTDDTWLTFIRDLAAGAKYQFYLDELGRVLFSPEQNISSLQPVYTYDDGNSSILYPEISMNRDLYGIPNVVEVLYSKGGLFYYAKAVNENASSPISTVNRGREIIHRITDPDLGGIPSERQVKEYAEKALSDLSCLEYTVSYSHGYCSVRVGDCVRLNYIRSGITDVKARVISQSIKCEPGCSVTEKAVFITKLWR